jgi:hypothetical protein
VARDISGVCEKVPVCRDIDRNRRTTMDGQLYAVALYAEIHEFTGVRTRVVASTVTAANPYEARGRALALAEQAFPIGEGYRSHMVSILLISNDRIAQAFYNILATPLTGE